MSRLLADWDVSLDPHPSLPPGPDTERFHGLPRSGLAAASPALFSLFYGKGTCLRLDEHMPCPPPDWRFYQVSGAQRWEPLMGQQGGKVLHLNDKAGLRRYLSAKCLRPMETLLHYIVLRGTRPVTAIG